MQLRCQSSCEAVCQELADSRTIEARFMKGVDVKRRASTKAVLIGDLGDLIVDPRVSPLRESHQLEIIGYSVSVETFSVKYGGAMPKLPNWRVSI